MFLFKIEQHQFATSLTLTFQNARWAKAASAFLCRELNSIAELPGAIAASNRVLVSRTTPERALEIIALVKAMPPLKDGETEVGAMVGTSDLRERLAAQRNLARKHEGAATLSSIDKTLRQAFPQGAGVAPKVRDSMPSILLLEQLIQERNNLHTELQASRTAHSIAVEVQKADKEELKAAYFQILEALPATPWQPSPLKAVATLFQINVDALQRRDDAEHVAQAADLARMDAVQACEDGEHMQTVLYKLFTAIRGAPMPTHLPVNVLVDAMLDTVEENRSELRIAHEKLNEEGMSPEEVVKRLGLKTREPPKVSPQQPLQETDHSK